MNPRAEAGTRGASPSAVACPRCGYDQAGLIASWQDSCPLRSQCSECGLGLEWSELFDEIGTPFSGFIEHVEPGLLGWRLAWAALQTWIRTLLPWRFWNHVKLQHRIRRRRWLVWILLLLGMLQVFGTVFRTSAYLRHVWRPGWMRSPAGASTMIQWAGIRPHSIEETIAVAIQLLLSPVCEVQGTWTWGPMPTSAAQLASVMMWKLEWNPASELMLLIPIGVTLAMFPMMLLVLPETRSRAKVRAAHVARGFVYSLSCVAFISLMYVVDALWSLMDVSGRAAAGPISAGAGRPWASYETLFGDFINQAGGLVFFVTPAWIALWWYFALSRGFRIRRALGVWVATFVPVLLAVIAAYLYIGFGAWVYL